MATASPALSRPPDRPRTEIPGWLKLAIPALMFMLGWYGNSRAADAQTSVNKSSIEELKTTKVSKDEFNQYVVQSLENQRAMREQLGQIREEIAAARRERK